MDLKEPLSSNENIDEHSTRSVDISSVILKLLKVQCVFMIEKELEALKNKNVLSDVQYYLENAEVINFHKILLTIVKSFTQQYFDEIKSGLTEVWHNVPGVMGGRDVEMGTTILDKCLTILEKRLFETLYDELDRQPIQYLSVLNMFDLSFVQKEEKYLIESDTLKTSLNDGRKEQLVASVKSVNIFELIKYVYYNAVIETKRELSTRILKKFIKDNVIGDYKKGKYQRNPCVIYNTDKTKSKRDSINEKKLKVVEYLIKEMWYHIPDLKSPIEFKCEALPWQLNSLISDREQNKNQQIVSNVERDEHFNWNYKVTRDGETMYLKAPSYDYIHEITPQLTRKLLDLTQITEKDIVESEKRKQYNSRKPDIFDVRMEAILNENKPLVGDELFDAELNTKPDVQTYFQIAQDYKKELKIRQKKWKVFEKKYFKVQEDSDEDDFGQVSIRPLEFSDLLPQIVIIKVAPISYEFEQIKYLCAACGYFIDRGTGVEAMNHKWHTNHFRCRACCSTFNEPSDAVLYKGNIVLCVHDANMIIK